MLALSLRPGVSLGSFCLGCSVNEALKIAKQNHSLFGCVELKYFGQASNQQDILLNFPEHGLHLVFDGANQRLRLLEIYDLSRMQVTQGSATVGGSAHPATIEAVYDLAGPTYPGHADPEHGVFVMHWPGLLILFTLNTQPAASWHDMQQGRAPSGALADGTAPVACRMCVHASNADSLDELAQVGPPLVGQVGSPSLEASAQQRVGVRIGKGLVLADTQQHLCFGDSPQDAWSALGAPSGTFSKQSTADCHGSFTPIDKHHQRAADYFYNYFDRGLDLLFCGQTHRLKKIVLHTNLPNHVSFGIYNKCHFAIPLDALKSGSTELQQQQTSASHTDEPPRHPQQLTSASPWDPQQRQRLTKAGQDWQRPHVSCPQADEGFSEPVHFLGKAVHDRQVPGVSQPQSNEGVNEHKQQAQLQEDYSLPMELSAMELPRVDLPGMKLPCAEYHNALRQQAQVPVQRWLNQAREADGVLPRSDGATSQSAPEAIQQALLSDIMAMTRAGSGSASSSSSQTQQDTVTAGHASSQLCAGPQSAAHDCQHGNAHEEERDGLEEEAQQQTQLTDEGGQAEAATRVQEGWGWGSEGLTQGSAGASNLDGWDETDPMAVLSQSAQLQARTQDRKSLQPASQSSADTTQQRVPPEQLSTTASQPAMTVSARVASELQSHRLPSVQAYSPVLSEFQSASNPHFSNDCDPYAQGSPAAQDWCTDQHDNSGSSTTAQPGLADHHDSGAMHRLTRDSCSPDNQHKAKNNLPSDSIPEQETPQGVDSTANESRFKDGKQAAAAVLTAESLLADVEHVLGQGDRAVIHTRGLGGDPFGPTMVYGYPGIVVEATQAGCIASVTLFDV